jgi:hypothetical protein
MMRENYVQNLPRRHFIEVHSFGDETNGLTATLADLLIIISLQALCSEEPIKTSINLRQDGETRPCVTVTPFCFGNFSDTFATRVNRNKCFKEGEQQYRIQKCGWK